MAKFKHVSPSELLPLAPAVFHMLLCLAEGHRFVNRPSSIARYLWASPTTTLGLIALIAGSHGVRIRIVEGVLEAHGPALAWMLRRLTLLPHGAAAITLGHVVLGRDQRSLDATRAHERVHVRQCEVWGPLFVPAYLVGSLVAGLRGRRFYEDNPFETEARAGARHRR